MQFVHRTEGVIGESFLSLDISHSCQPASFPLYLELGISRVEAFI